MDLVIVFVLVEIFVRNNVNLVVWSLLRLVGYWSKCDIFEFFKGVYYEFLCKFIDFRFEDEKIGNFSFEDFLKFIGEIVVNFRIYVEDCLFDDCVVFFFLIRRFLILLVYVLF